MFKKVLVAEDLGSIGHGVASMLKEKTENIDIHQSQYCDDAFLKFRRAEQDNTPFELLITDLSFKACFRERKLTSGIELISAIKAIQPTIKVIMYSIEDRPTKISTFFKKLEINGYVCKSRYGLKELEHSIEEVYNDNIYISPQISNALNKKNVFELNDYDIILLKYLSKGLTQDQIAKEFKKEHISPHSISSVEKRLNKLKQHFKAKNGIHLVAMIKDLGLL
ncbi:response regulator transcription factor [Aquimarina hainanensis]|uniref:Response regulator transcription factor n=1 Tax=Aquimarina hainanensis TaxID=1578017 RepID=A0ABW5NCK1_9FLAO|nr:response regulator transcription factor [Aquimarina sp. TRL1]QKX05515.1 response regulator transcription factor [Aquimarina sp. TRL1]